MTEKEPVLLVTLIDTQSLHWRIGAVGLDGRAQPLICSNEGDLAGYEGLEFETQVTFLRHRFAGALQVGCDRLRTRDQRPCQFAFVCDGWFPHAPPELTRQVAEHFAEWMANPPVVFYRHAIAADDREEPHFDRLAGNIGAAERDALLVGVGELKRATENSERWELIERPK